MLPRIARHFWNSNLVCQVISKVFRFIRFFSFFRMFFTFFLSCCTSVLKMSYVSETSSYYLLSFQWSFVNPKSRCCSTLNAGYLQHFNIVYPGSDNLRKKGCQKGKGFRVFFFFFNFCNWLPLIHVLISTDFRWTYNCLVKNIHKS